jgi:hypothetical protein
MDYQALREMKKGLKELKSKNCASQPFLLFDFDRINHPIIDLVYLG